MPTTSSDYSAVEAARKKAGALGERALGLQAGAETFGDRVMKDVRSARASRGTSMLAQDIGTTTGQLASEGSAMRERLSGVNPLDVINLTARQRAGTLGTLATQAQAQTGIEGTIQEVIGGGVNQLRSAALLKQAEAQKATEEANTLLEQLQLRESQAAREFEEWAKRQQISQGWAQVNKPSGGGGFTDYQLYNIEKEQQEQQGEVSTALGLIQNIRNLLPNISTGRFGGLLEKLQSFTGWDPSLRQVKQNIDLLTPMIAKNVMRLGRLSDKDVELAMGTIADIGTVGADNPEELESKLSTLENVLRKGLGSGEDSNMEEMFEKYGGAD